MATSGKRSQGSASRKRVAGYSRRSYSRNPYTSKRPTYRTVTNNFRTKINSYQTLVKQSQGPKSGGPTPSNLNYLAKWVDKGAVIQTVSNAQLQRWSHTNKTYTSPTSVRTVLTKKFGKTPIKAICPGKGNNFIVATSPTWKGKMFKFPR
ncbi:MAG: hypothetical protein JSV19_07840 [Phycisphaerales bacterium]|nr:MAG: hypothetical protein JSV19_07840 [Phycisphaerales bacterium]